MHPRRHGAERAGLGAEVATRRPPARSPTAYRSRSEVSASAQPADVRQRLLDDAEVAPLPRPAHERRRDVVEAGLVEGDEHVDRRCAARR